MQIPSVARGRRAVSMLAAAFLLGAIVPPAGWAAVPMPLVPPMPPVPTSADPIAVEPLPATLEPGIHWEDAAAHADDQISFPVGERVSVAFAPRPTDRWAVDGAGPVRLPAARRGGAELRAQATGDAVAAPTTTPSAPRVDAALPSGSSAAPRAVTTAAVVADPGDPSAALAPVSAGGLRREVFGFLPYWELSDTSTTYDWDVLSTVAYFSVGANKNGDLIKTNADGTTSTGWAGWTSAKLTSVINAAHQHGTRVVLTISCFAWTSGQQDTQAALLGSATARSNLAKQVAAAVADRGADGVNLDFEPIVSGYADEFTSLVRSVRAELDAIAPGYQLTFDTTGWIGNYPLEAATAPGGADAIFIMGYDYRTSSASSAGSISPLNGPAYDLTDTIAAYAARVSPSKLILGVPYYGRAWSTDSDALHAKNISGTQYGSSVTSVYATAVELAQQNGRRWDATEATPWTAYRRETCTTTYGCQTAWRELYYDDATSLKLRYDLVNQTGLRGVGIWALGYDNGRPELYQALADKFLNDTTPPRAGITALPQTSPDLGFDVAWTGLDESSIAEFDVQVATDGGAWAPWLANTSALHATWLGQDGHAYAFRARARDSHGNVSDWSSVGPSPVASLAVGGFGTVVVDTLNVRAAPTTSATLVATLHAGDALAITDGPVSAGGYTWWEVSGPILQWPSVDLVESGVWVAASSSGATFVAARRPIHATVVDAIVHGFGYAGSRLVTPNGDGDHDTVRLTWTADQAFDDVTIRVVRWDGAILGSIDLGPMAAGAAGFTWDGRLGGGPVPDGTVVLQLIATAGGVTRYGPAANPASPEQVQAFGLTVDHLPVTRLAGADRYATAVAISKATYAPGVPVAYLATGTGFADALAGAPAAGLTKGPILLVTPTSIPSVVAAELARLKPARIVILGGTGVVGAAVASAAEAAVPF